MECAEIKQLLSAYVDGQAAPEERKSVDAHVAQCPDCRQELDFLRACVKEVASLPRAAAPPDFLQKVRQRIERRKTFEEVVAGFFKPSRTKTQAVAVLATVLLVVGVYRIMEPEFSRQLHRSQQRLPVMGPARAASSASFATQAPVALKASLAESMVEPPKDAEGANDVSLVDHAQSATALSQETENSQQLSLPMGVDKLQEVSGRSEEAFVPLVMERRMGEQKIPSQDKYGGISQSMGIMAVSAARQVPEHAEAMFQQGLEPGAMKSPPALSFGLDVAGMSLNEALERITRFVRARQGNVVSVSPEQGGEAGIEVSVPAGQYRAFLDDLAEIVSVPEIARQAPAASSDPVKAVIRLRRPG